MAAGSNIYGPQDGGGNEVGSYAVKCGARGGGWGVGGCGGLVGVGLPDLTASGAHVARCAGG